jgi:8-oxo-dGTP diphosphatase
MPTDKTDQGEQAYLTHYDSERYRKPSVMVDIVIFTIEDDALKVLLVKRGVYPFKGHYALPGGAVNVENDQSLEQAALRELTEETGVENRYLEQMQTYGSATRDPRDWTISVAYFALVAAKEVQLRAGSDASEASWHKIDGNAVDLPLAFDHAVILQDAIERLRSKLDYSDIAVHLLSEEFTLSELQRVYEIIMQEKLNKSSFRQRVERAGLVQAIEGKMRTGSNRPAQLYRFVQSDQPRVFFPRSIVWAEREK